MGERINILSILIGLKQKKETDLDQMELKYLDLIESLSKEEREYLKNQLDNLFDMILLWALGKYQNKFEHKDLFLYVQVFIIGLVKDKDILSNLTCWTRKSRMHVASERKKEKKAGVPASPAYLSTSRESTWYVR